MTRVIYHIVPHDGGFAYRVFDGVDDRIGHGVAGVADRVADADRARDRPDRPRGGFTRHVGPRLRGVRLAENERRRQKDGGAREDRGPTEPGHRASAPR